MSRATSVRSSTLAVATSVLMVARARAQEPAPPKLWTNFEATSTHATVAGLACQLEVTAVFDGERSRPIELSAYEDDALICTSSKSEPNAIHGRVIMTNDASKRPSEVVLSIEVPANSTPRDVESLRTFLRNIADELHRRATPTSTVVQPQPPPPPPDTTPAVPTHQARVTNWGLIGAGGAMFGGGWLLSALVGLPIAGSSTYPGTPTYWPFVPFVGLTVFSATYTEVSDCGCGLGRVLSVIASGVIDAVQIAGVVVIIAGAISPKVATVRDALNIRIRPGGFVWEGRF